MGNKNDIPLLLPFSFSPLPNFPFIENTIDSVTMYQLYCKLGEYANSIGKTVNEIIEEINTNFAEYVEKNLNKFLINSAYDENTETLIIKNVIISNGDYHIYGNNTMTIE